MLTKDQAECASDALLTDERQRKTDAADTARMKHRRFLAWFRFSISAATGFFVGGLLGDARAGVFFPWCLVGLLGGLACGFLLSRAYAIFAAWIYAVKAADVNMFTARPDRIIGNVAVASLVAGLPLGLGFSVLGVVIDSGEQPALEIIKDIAVGTTVVPFFIAVCGLFLVGPVLALLRVFGCGGPFFVYGISVAFGMSLMDFGVGAGLSVIVIGLVASHVFCRFAYADD